MKKIIRIDNGIIDNGDDKTINIPYDGKIILKVYNATDTYCAIYLKNNNSIVYFITVDAGKTIYAEYIMKKADYIYFNNPTGTNDNIHYDILHEVEV